MENISSRKKRSRVRQENASMTIQSEQLIADFDPVQYDLATFNLQVWETSLCKLSFKFWVFF